MAVFSTITRRPNPDESAARGEISGLRLQRRARARPGDLAPVPRRANHIPNISTTPPSFDSWRKNLRLQRPIPRRLRSAVGSLAARSRTCWRSPRRARKCYCRGTHGGRECECYRVQKGRGRYGRSCADAMRTNFRNYALHEGNLSRYVARLRQAERGKNRAPTGAMLPIKPPIEISSVTLPEVAQVCSFFGGGLSRDSLAASSGAMFTVSWRRRRRGVGSAGHPPEFWRPARASKLGTIFMTVAIVGSTCRA